jgi:hypothetical protein
MGSHEFDAAPAANPRKQQFEWNFTAFGTLDQPAVSRCWAKFLLWRLMGSHKFDAASAAIPRSKLVKWILDTSDTVEEIVVAFLE